jgi:hypothetical protein
MTTKTKPLETLKPERVITLPEFERKTDTYEKDPDGNRIYKTDVLPGIQLTIGEIITLVDKNMLSRQQAFNMIFKHDRPDYLGS